MKYADNDAHWAQDFKQKKNRFVNIISFGMTHESEKIVFQVVQNKKEEKLNSLFFISLFSIRPHNRCPSKTKRNFNIYFLISIACECKHLICIRVYHQFIFFYILLSLYCFYSHFLLSFNRFTAIEMLIQCCCVHCIHFILIDLYFSLVVCILPHFT